MNTFPEDSPFKQEEDRLRLWASTQDKACPPVDPAEVRAGLEREKAAAMERHARTTTASEQDIMEIRSDISTSLAALGAGDTGSATRILEDVYDKLYTFLR